MPLWWKAGMVPLVFQIEMTMLITDMTKIVMLTKQIPSCFLPWNTRIFLSASGFITHHNMLINQCIVFFNYI